jgi:Na+-translocating ferredoxin:NAD+ oxidoreductase subunit B
MRPNRASERPAEIQDDRAVSIDRLLPQTQCGRCGYAGCRPYAEAIAASQAPINRCPPGGDATIAALAGLLGRMPSPLDPACGAPPLRSVAAVDNTRCIGCTKCILACPVDAIVGAPRHQHQVLSDRCTGCELCLPPCPVDCIVMQPLAEPWSAADAARGRHHHRARQARLAASTASAVSDHAPDDRQSTRDPLVVLGAAEERSRRLARILERVRNDGAA